MKTNPFPRSAARPGTGPTVRSPQPSAQPPARPARPPSRERTDQGPLALPGTLLVKWINGRNGEFAVGDLRTSIGEFRVKDSLLDQFDEGAYEGTFWISQIFSKSYEYRGRITIETRAVLADMQVDDEADSSAPDTEPAELDPVDEPPPPPPAVQAPSARKPKAQPPTGEGSDDQAIREADRQLFGDELFEQVASGQPVKLDPAIGDRLRLREQRDRLKKGLGYGFDSLSQTWYPPTP